MSQILRIHFSSCKTRPLRVRLVVFINTVEPPCATTSPKRSTADPKRQNFPSQRLTVGTSSKRPPPVSDRDRDHFLCLTVNAIPLFLTSCKRPLEAFSDLYFRCVI